jgi:glycosyltransferase involved in cell wall biosynthesis
MLKTISNYNDTSIIIPCFNEENTISKVIDQFKSQLPGVHILVVDNGSTDKTFSLAKLTGVRVLQELQRGKGFAVRTGFRECNTPVLLMVDGDLTYDPFVAGEMIENIRNGFDMVVANRKLSSTSAYRKGHKIGNRFFSYAQSVMFDSMVSDSLSGYRAFSNLFIESFVMQPRGFEIEASLNIHADLLNAKVKNIDTNYFARPPGSFSKLSTLSDGLKILSTILKYMVKYRPYFVFSYIAIALLLVSFSLSLIPGLEFLRTGKILHIPTLITSMSIGIIAVLTLFYGLISQRIIEIQMQSMRMNYNLFKTTKSLFKYPKNI